MHSFFFEQTHHDMCKNKVDFYIVSWVVLLITVVVFPAFSDTEKTHSSVNNDAKAILQNSVALLPFENMSPDPNDAYIAAGIHHEILDNLATVREMNAISRPSVLRYKDTDKSIAEIASELNVGSIMKGSAHYADNQINIAIQFIDAQTNKQLWSEVYEGKLSDIFAIQAEIAERIVVTLGAEMSAFEKDRIKKPSTTSLDAYAFYLRARASILTSGSAKPPEFFSYLDQAIALDPNFALAHAVKASEYSLAKLAGVPIGAEHGMAPEAGSGLTFADLERIALEHADIALALDPDLGLAHKAIAEIHRTNRHGAESDKIFDRAYQLSPNEVEILKSYSRLLSTIDKHDKSIQLAQRAVDLAPNDYNWYNLLGGVLMTAGRSAESVEAYQRAVAIKPSAIVHRNIGMMQVRLGNESEALKEFRSADRILENSALLTPVAKLAYGYSILGLREDALRLSNQFMVRAANIKIVRPGDWALSYLAVGEVEKAYDILSKYPNEGLVSSLQEIKVNLMNDPVLEQPRFVALRKRLAIH